MRRLTQAVLTIGVVICFLLSCAQVQRKPASVVVDKPEREPWCEAKKSNATEAKLGIKGSLADVSELFRQAAQRAKERECASLENHGLLIRYYFGNVEARFNGVSFGPSHSVYTPQVHVLKAVSHSIQLVALLVGESPPEQRVHAEEATTHVTRLRREFDDASAQPRQWLSADQVARQLRILDAVIRVLGEIKAQQLTDSARTEFFVTVRAPLKENLKDSSRAVLLELHKTVVEYRARAEQLDPTAWSTVRVVAGVGHQSREQEVGVQYFARLLGETVTAGARGEDRLVVAEGVFPPPMQRGLVSAHVVDRKASELVFDDPVRLQWDVLGDNAGVLHELLPAE